MTDKEYREYLASLKAGDVVSVFWSKYSEKRLNKETVIRITPTGRVTTDKAQYMPDGYRIGCSDYGPSVRIVGPSVADETRQEIMAKNRAEFVIASIRSIPIFGPLTQDQHDKAMELIEQLKEVLT